MSRILVADDNSNIQKMVALALKDEGIDVVAVGNGDAAMRKIPDLRPDLVLADIFMPVRNGYEVCEFVKSDSRYMNTPVVLLVGAFDPLDEQETQRVRADGVLKKPFVPPDPLINMVKALLAKSNGQKAEPVMVAAPIKSALSTHDAPVPEGQPAPSNQAPAAPTQVLPRDNAKVSSPAQAPPAFVKPAQRSEAQAAKADDSDEVVTAVRDPNLGDPFWATPEQTEETEENAETETDPKDMVDMHSFGKAGHSDDEEIDDRPHFRPDSAILDSTDTLVSPNKATAPETNRSQAMPVNEEETNAVVAESKNAAPSPLPEPAPAPAETPAEIFKFDPTLTFATSTQEESVEQESSEADHAPLMEAKAPEPIEQEPALLSWAEPTEATAEPRVTPEKPLHTHEEVAPIELDLPALPNREAVISAATEAARLAFSEMNTLPGSGASAESVDATEAKKKDSLPASMTGGAPNSPTPEMIESVVSRLLERMQPQIMEVVNREVLRPAIEAIVRQEMKKA